MWLSFYLGTFFVFMHPDNPDILVVRGETEEDLERLLSSMSSEDLELCPQATLGKTEVEHLLCNLDPKDRESFYLTSERALNDVSTRLVEMPREIFSRVFVDKEEDCVDFMKCDCWLPDDDEEEDSDETES